MKSHRFLPKDLLAISRRSLEFGIAILALVSRSISQDAQIRVINPSEETRTREPIVVSLRLSKELSSLPTSKTVSVLNDRGQLVPSQSDDFDGDGIVDEVVFLGDYLGKEQRIYKLRVQEFQGKRFAFGEQRTHAAIWKRKNGKFVSIDDDVVAPSREPSLYRYDGVGWESELVAYRLYLDQRNAVDVFGKRHPGLILDRIGTSEDDYQQDLEWGMDVLHVGSALGVGGFGIWSDGKIVKPDSVREERCRILARGPIRSIVRIDYSDWVIGEEKISVISLFTILASERVTEVRILFREGRSPNTVAVGIVKHDSAAAVWNQGGGWLYTLGPQSRTGDSLLLALNFESSSIAQKVDAMHDHVVLLRAETGQVLRYFIASAWQGEQKGMWSKDEVERFLGALSRRLNEPMKVEILQ